MKNEMFENAGVGEGMLVAGQGDNVIRGFGWLGTMEGALQEMEEKTDALLT